MRRIFYCLINYFYYETNFDLIVSPYIDMKEENCQYEKSILKRKLAESAIEIERQVGESKSQFVN